MSKSKLIKAANDFSLTQFQHTNKVYQHLHRGDLFSIRLQCTGGYGGVGLQKRNTIGGQGGDVKLEGTRKKDYKDLTQVLETCRDRKSQVTAGETKSEKYFNNAPLQLQRGTEDYFKKGFSIETDDECPNKEKKMIKMKAFKGKDATRLGTAFKGSDLTLTVPLNMLLYEEIYKEDDSEYFKIPSRLARSSFRPPRKILTDLKFVTEIFNPKQSVILAHGGDPGCFQTGYRGQPGETRFYQLVQSEKADVLILGHSNSGKTTLFQRLTGRRLGSLISSGSFTTLGVQSGKVTYLDGKQCKVLDTPDFNLMSDLEMAQRVTKSKCVLLLVDPFGYQPNIETEKKEPIELILEMVAAVTEAKNMTNFTGTNKKSTLPEIKTILVFNKLDLPGAKEKMEETVKELNSYQDFLKTGLKIKFEKILAISAEKNQGVDVIKDYSRLVNDKYYKKYLIGRDHQRLLALGKKWPPPSLKGPDAPVVADFPREAILRYKLENEMFKKRRLGGHMMIQAREGLPEYKKSVVQDYANLVHIKTQVGIEEANRKRIEKMEEKKDIYFRENQERKLLEEKERLKDISMGKEKREEIRNLQQNKAVEEVLTEITPNLKLEI